MHLHPNLVLSLAHFQKCRRGVVGVLVGVLLPVLAVGAVGVAELAEVLMAMAKLQRNVDAAAIQGAGEFGVDQSTATMERTRLYADAMAEPLRLRWAITSTAMVDTASRTVTVNQTGHRASFFRSLLPPGGWNIAATAMAIRTARKPLCVLGAQDAAKTALGYRAPV